MAGDVETGAVVEFYDTHPINEKQILDKLRADGIDLNTITEDILQAYDQDHFGGVAADDALAQLAEIDARCHVLDICCGMGGPSRWLAHNCGCRVTGIDMTESRIEGARRLTAMAGLSDSVALRCANALDMPFDDDAFDVAISQEAFCHIPDMRRLVAECARVVRPGGRIAFTDILATETMTRTTAERLQRDMTFNDLATAGAWRDMFGQEGFNLARIDDLGGDWRLILVDRLAMYRSLKDQTADRFGEAHFDKWDRAYSHFVGLFETGELSGGRFLFRRNG
jgi:ubiquinone/menaquinone biosynthesis C-methylase UbiE